MSLLNARRVSLGSLTLCLWDPCVIKASPVGGVVGNSVGVAPWVWIHSTNSHSS